MILMHVYIFSATFSYNPKLKLDNLLEILSLRISAICKKEAIYGIGPV